MVNNLKRAPGVVIEECLQQNVALGGENIAAMAANIRHFPLSPQHDQNPLCVSIVSVTHSATKACLVHTLPQLIPHQAHFVLPSSVIPVLFLRHEFSEVLIDFCNSLLKRKIQL